MNIEDVQLPEIVEWKEESLSCSANYKNTGQSKIFGFEVPA
jgi:hypothetical protein